MSAPAVLSGFESPLLFLKATRKKRVFVPTFTRSNGVVVQGHYADVNVSDDHDDHRVLSGQGSHSQRAAHAKLSQRADFNALPHDHRVNLLLHHATKIQDKASQAAAISGWRANAMGGRNPTMSQWRAFYSLSIERKGELIAEASADGRSTAHMHPPAMPASDETRARMGEPPAPSTAPPRVIAASTPASAPQQSATSRSGWVARMVANGSPSITHDGGEWFVVGQGVRGEAGTVHAGMVFAHLASKMFGRFEGSSWNPRQTNEWIPDPAASTAASTSAALAPTEPVTVVPAAPASGGAAIPSSTAPAWMLATNRELADFQPGATKVVAGVTYVLRDGRWHRQSGDVPTAQDASITAVSPARQGGPARAGATSAPAVVMSPVPPDRTRAARAMGAVTVPTFPATSASNAGCVRRVASLQALATAGDIDGITNFSTSRTRANYAAVADYREQLLSAAQNLTPEAAVAAVQAPPPAAPAITGANMENTALLAAKRKVAMLSAALDAPDPVAAIMAIRTSRGNRYLDAADNYKRALLAHLGVDIGGVPVPGVTAEGLTPAPSTPRVVAAAEAPAVRAPAPAPPVVRALAPAAPPRAAEPAPVPDAQNPVLAANRLGLSPAVLGFAPRPNVPLTTRTNQGRVAWPDPRMEEINRRYLAQSTALQQQAREYQAGTFTPLTPEQAAAARVAEAARQRAEQEAIRAAAAAVTARIGNIDALFRPRATIGANITAANISDDSRRGVEQMFGVPHAQAMELFKSIVADYGGGVRFTMNVSGGPRSTEVRLHGSDGTSITRQFSKDSAGKITVYHAYFSAGTTGNGSGRNLFRTSMGAYKALGVTEVGVTANIDVGGYAWARFGYLPRQWSSLQRTLSNRLDSIARGYAVATTRGVGERRLDALTPAQVEKVRGVLNNPAPETLWAIADMKLGERPIGKELLLGTNWSGVMPLSNKRVMLRFSKYVTPREA